MLTRHAIRTKVLQACYAALSSGSPIEQVFNQLLSEDYDALVKAARDHEAKNRSADSTSDEDAVFLRELYYGAMRRRAEHEARIAPALEHWELERVALIDRILLLLGVEELLHHAEIPVKVTINEYLDLAREFSTDKSSQFLNGILDRIYHSALSAGEIRKTGKGLLDTPVLG